MYQKNEIKPRVLEEARYVIDNNATVRQTARVFGISKSTVHKDISERLWSYSPILATKANLVFEKNKKERAICYKIKMASFKRYHLVIKKARCV